MVTFTEKILNKKLFLQCLEPLVCQPYYNLFSPSSTLTSLQINQSTHSINFKNFPSPLHLLKVQSRKICDNKYMVASTQITNTEIFACISVLVFKLLSRKDLIIKRKDKRNLLKSRLIFKKRANFTGKLLQNYI